MVRCLFQNKLKIIREIVISATKRVSTIQFMNNPRNEVHKCVKFIIKIRYIKETFLKKLYAALTDYIIIHEDN